jgi:hypothetical protein
VSLPFQLLFAKHKNYTTDCKDFINVDLKPMALFFFAELTILAGNIFPM